MFDETALVKELIFKAIKSSGAGGQHVNKTASKIELTFNLRTSEVFNKDQKLRLQKKLKTRLSKDGVLIMQCGDSRSQFRNKVIVIKRFLELLKMNLLEDKKRIPTNIPKGVIKKRLTNKRKRSEKKANRKPPELD
ncbi:alternative ribosome rescue aminoacyl-tRNA hydrolase ArfB [Psychroserpens sp. MEBiC05023]